ncbi:MAG: Orc1/cdc6 family replication initiation protein [Methanomicrobiales archaeon 53_19]|nr:MAG: Orc1/cdc6 family replication initiation protein [Methanomicrobiales archaeon 53_19]
MQSFSRSLRFSEKPLFKDADLLECDHIPDQVLFRDDELEELAFLIRPGLRGQRPANILCRGLPATGKTTCIHHLFAEIRHLPGAGGTLIPVYVNCQRSRTAFAVFSTIYRELVGHAPPSSGIPLRRLMDAVAKALQSGRQSWGESRGDPRGESGRRSPTQSERQYERESGKKAGKQSERPILLVCLDDIHHLIHEGTATQILSSLLRIYLDYPGCRVSVILVESDLSLDLSRALDRSVTSSLCAQEVFFAPYTATQIRGILKERARQAVYPGVIAPGVLNLITDRTTGTLPVDLRVGLDLLKRSILRAERAAHTSVTEEDVAAAYGDARVTYLRGLVSGLTGKERALLSLIAEMEEGARIREEEARKREEETRNREEEARKREEETRNREEEARKREESGLRETAEMDNSGENGESSENDENDENSDISKNDSIDMIDMIDDPMKRRPTSGQIYSRLQEMIEEDQRRRRSLDAAAKAGEVAAAACAEPDPGYSTGKRGPNTPIPHTPTSCTPTPCTPFPYSSCSYTSFYEHLRSLESYKLIGIKGVQGRGKTSAITLRYAAADVKRLCDAEEARQGEGEKMEKR